MKNIKNTAARPELGRKSSGRFMAAAVAMGALALSGCANTGGTGQAATPGGTDTGTATAAATTQNATLTVEQPWMKAADSGMTAVFGTLTNDGDTPVTLTGAQADGISESAELHETVMDEATGSTKMQEMTEPLVIEPGASVTLEPGADHIMLMDLTCAPMAGQNLEIQLDFDGGDSQTVEVPVRDYQGAQEEYAHEDHGAEPSDSAIGDAEHGMDDMHATEGTSHSSLPMCQDAQ
ncbi:copper chaperone PCu(A)C [Kocuria sp.]|uniref:copper chaperone PCu(A)C n=1 Tax=Kocuria sp. TaxID=1871328 RepID=UPI0026DF9C4D|nr:copper chaperone PCu(A)C [Kocuria sp.]MDO5618631.1 copper chaperone PCu(A)C [Kocuria sp.]